MATDKSTYAWLSAEIASIRTRGFHVLLPDMHIDFQIENGSKFSISGYSEFLREFGWAQLYRYPADGSNGPLVSVYPLRESRIQNLSGKNLIEFGYKSNTSALFDLDKLHDQGESPVFSVRGKNAYLEFDSFAEWLRSSCEWARHRFSKKKWEIIKNGPESFSEKERLVVEARKRFKWRHVGFANNGDAIFEVRNESDVNLPYLSIGVQGVDQSRLIGGVWLDVSKINPGEVGLVVHECYKEILSPEEVEFFDKLNPIPETKERYWEFKDLKKPL